MNAFTHLCRTRRQSARLGILFNIPEMTDAEQKIWPSQLEFQICEGGAGDFWMTDGAAITPKASERVVGPESGALLPRHLPVSAQEAVDRIHPHPIFA